jgi:hypothetical protein
VFNPLTVLKPFDPIDEVKVDYYFGFSLETRSSSVPNAFETHYGGAYQYSFYTQYFPEWYKTDIIFYDTYANTPTWYVTAVIIAGIVGVIVYLVCKKKKMVYN